MKTEKLNVNWMFPLQYSDETKERWANELDETAAEWASNMTEQNLEKISNAEPGSLHAIAQSAETWLLSEDGEPLHLLCFVCVTRGADAACFASVEIHNIVAPQEQIVAMRELTLSGIIEMAKKTNARINIIERRRASDDV